MCVRQCLRVRTCKPIEERERTVNLPMKPETKRWPPTETHGSSVNSDVISVDQSAKTAQHLTRNGTYCFSRVDYVLYNRVFRRRNTESIQVMKQCDRLRQSTVRMGDVTRDELCLELRELCYNHGLT
jgi:hypothetical protein